MLGSIGNWFGNLGSAIAANPMKSAITGLGALQTGAGLIGLIQQIKQGRPTTREQITKAVAQATPAEQQLAQMYTQRVNAIQTPQQILTDPTIRAAMGQAFGGAQADMVRAAQENLQARGFGSLANASPSMWGIGGSGAGSEFSGGSPFAASQAELQNQVNRQMIDYALNAPQVQAQSLAPMGNLLTNMMNMRMNMAPQMTTLQGPRPTLLQAFQGAAPILQGGLNALKYASKMPGRTQPGGMAPRTTPRFMPNLQGQYRDTAGPQSFLYGGAFPGWGGGLSAPKIDY